MKLARFAMAGVIACSANKPIADPTLPLPAGDQLMHDMTDAYTRTSRYRDSGTAELKIGGNTERGTFTVARITGAALRFEFHQQGQPPLVVWTDGHDADIGQNGKLSVGHAGLDLAIGGVVARVVDQARDGRSPFVDGTALTVDLSELIDGHTCWRITGRTIRGTLTAWIDARSRVVRRTVEKLRGLHGVDIALTIDYKPELDPAIADSEIARPEVNKTRDQPQWIGVGFDPGGAKINRVFKDSPAARAGFQARDEIKKLDGQPIEVTKFREAMAMAKPGASFAVTVDRAGKEVELQVTTAPRPEISALQQGLVDHPAPSFALTRITGTSSPRLADLLGNVVVIDFWATWCGPCRSSMPHLDALSAKYATKGLRIIGVTDEDAATVNEFLKSNPVRYTLARDPDDAIANAYLVQGLPTLIVLDRSGVVRYTQFGVGDFTALDTKIAGLLAQPAKPSNAPP